MATGDDIKLPLTSRDVHEERLARFRELFPEAFSEGKTDLKRLTQLLGDASTDAPERYGLSWAGKSDAIRAIQITSPGTLLPARSESVNFDSTEHLIIEGDNLEVLKLLQGGYHGRVKVICIDPPYNTGGEFIYPDNYKEGLADYLKFSGQASSEGIKLTTNAETDGRYHSKWLTMMYPRLFLARNLLREDGVIFVSIDDHEVHNLRAVMNEIFGEENFVANIIWEKKFAPQNDARYFSDNHDHIVLYARNRDSWQRNLLPRTEQANERFQNPDNDHRGPWASSDLLRMEHRDNSVYTVTSPTGRTWRPEPGTSWRHPEDEMQTLIKNNEVWFGADGNSKPRRKRFLKDVRQGIVPQTIWTHEDCGHNQEGTQTFKALFDGLGLEFNNPKPVRLIQYMLKIGSAATAQDLVLDFFAGSGTTAQAVLELNALDGGSRKFILVQLPEPTERKDFPTIADITKERVRRVIKKMEQEIAAKERKERKEKEGRLPLGRAEATAPQSNLDLGFKAFKLSSSNFKVWDAASAPKDGAGLAEQLKLMAHNVEEGRPDEALLYELVLKSNLPLTSKIQSGKIGEQTYYDVADGTLAMCLERPVQQESLRGLVARKPKGVICLDIAFAGNDQLKANTVLEMKSHGIEFHTA